MKAVRQQIPTPPVEILEEIVVTMTPTEADDYVSWYRRNIFNSNVESSISARFFIAIRDVSK